MPVFRATEPQEKAIQAMNTTIQIASRERLIAERLRRRWTQLEVADHLGTTPGNVSRWERGITSPGPYFRSRLCELFGMSAQELGLSHGGPSELNLLDQESADQEGLAQAVAQFLKTQLLDNMGAVVLVILNSNVGSQASSLHKGLPQSRTASREDCCDEYQSVRGSLRQRQGA